MGKSESHWLVLLLLGNFGHFFQVQDVAKHVERQLMIEGGRRDSDGSLFLQEGNCAAHAAYAARSGFPANHVTLVSVARCTPLISRASDGTRTSIFPLDARDDDTRN